MAMEKPVWTPGMKQNRLEAKLHLPAGFEVLLTRFSREVIRHQPPNILSFAAEFFDRQLTVAYGGSSKQESSFLEKLKTKCPKDDQGVGPATAEITHVEQREDLPEVSKDTCATQPDQETTERMTAEPEMQEPGEQQMAGQDGVTEEIIPYGEVPAPDQAEVIEEVSRAPDQMPGEQEAEVDGMDVSVPEQQEIVEQQLVDEALVEMQAPGGQTFDQRQVYKEFGQQEVPEEFCLPEAREELAQEEVLGDFAQQEVPEDFVQQEVQEGFAQQEVQEEFAQQEVQEELVQHGGDVQGEPMQEMPVDDLPFDQQAMQEEERREYYQHEEQLPGEQFQSEQVGETNFAEDVPQHPQHYEPVFGIPPDQEPPQAVSNMEVEGDNVGVEEIGQEENYGAQQLVDEVEVAPQPGTLETEQGVQPGEEAIVDVQQEDAEQVLLPEEQYAVNELVHETPVADAPEETQDQEHQYENLQQLNPQEEQDQEMQHNYENVQEVLQIDGQVQEVSSPEVPSDPDGVTGDEQQEPSSTTTPEPGSESIPTEMIETSMEEMQVASNN